MLVKATIINFVVYYSQSFTPYPTTAIIISLFFSFLVFDFDHSVINITLIQFPLVMDVLILILNSIYGTIDLLYKFLEVDETILVFLSYFI